MTRILLTLFAALLLGGAAAPVGAQTAQPDYASVNKAGRQRMLTQRIVKAYAQVGLDVFAEQSREQIADSVAQFEAHLAELRRHAQPAAVRERLARQERLWTPFKALASGPVTRDGVRRLLEMEEPLLAAAQETTTLLQQHLGTSVARLVDLSGRQRMLSQRLAKLYMLKAWGFSDVGIEQDMARAQAEFEGALARLQVAPENSYAINRELEQLALQWTWFQTALEQDPEYASFRLVVADSCEHMLASISTVTRLYEELARR